MTKAKMSVAELDAFLLKEFPQAFAAGNITIERADGTSCRIRERFHERMLRPGGTVSGPTLMALADFAMYVVLLSAIGPVGLAVSALDRGTAIAEGLGKLGAEELLQFRDAHFRCCHAFPALASRSQLH